MLTERQLFLQHLAQTSKTPMMLEIVKAEGMYLYDKSGKSFMDLIAGISVSNLGHRHPKVIKAVKKQLDEYSYLMVYGEYIQSPQVQLAKLLNDHLPKGLDTTYFVNSGSEAIEGAMKLAKRYTGRTEIIAFNNAYHGSTQGALSISGNEYFKKAYQPLLPEIILLQFNHQNDLKRISDKTACVVIEPIQGEGGVVIPGKQYLKDLRKKCDETGALLILDEIQTGFGRTGSLFAFEQYDIEPDILALAKGMGGGMPLGAFISSQKIMSSLKTNPELGHITTFGGHPVCCAAGLANLKELLEGDLIKKVKEEETLFKKLLVHPVIKEIRSKGLLIAIEFDDFETNKKVIDECIKNGIIVDWFLNASHCMRIAPPLIISEKEIESACNIIINSINKISN